LADGGLHDCFNNKVHIATAAAIKVNVFNNVALRGHYPQLLPIKALSYR